MPISLMAEYLNSGGKSKNDIGRHFRFFSLTALMTQSVGMIAWVLSSYAESTSSFIPADLPTR
jgi:hypothetical protein